MRSSPEQLSIYKAMRCNRLQSGDRAARVLLIDCQFRRLIVIMQRWLLTLGFTAASAFASHQALAQAVTIDVVNFSVPHNINAHITVQNGANYIVNNEYVMAGQVQLVTTNPTGTYLTWCTDIYDNLHTGALNLTTLTNGGGTAGQLTATTISHIGYLMNNYNVRSSTLTLDAALNQLSAATQLAIWIVEYTSLGDTVSFTSDDNFLNPTAAGGGNYVQSLINQPFAGFSATVNEYAATGGGNQNQSFLGNGTNVVEVPEPTSALLLSGAVTSLGVFRRRFRRMGKQT